MLNEKGYYGLTNQRLFLQSQSGNKQLHRIQKMSTSGVEHLFTASHIWRLEEIKDAYKTIYGMLFQNRKQINVLNNKKHIA